MYSNFSFTDQVDIQKIAWEALQKQKKQQTRAEERDQLVEERQNSIDYGAAVFEEYSTDGWVSKIKKDANIYNVFLENAEEPIMEKIQILVSNLLSTTNTIYEHINIKPSNYGFQNLHLPTDKHSDDTVLEASAIDLENEGIRIVNTYLDKHYYAMGNHERKKLYQERVQNMAKDIVLNEDINIDEAVEHAYKSVVIENLVEAINFPRPAYYRIQELMTSEAYGEVFEQDKLVELWNDFKTKSNTLSRVFAQLV
jgi:hypothetical protein